MVENCAAVLVRGGVQSSTAAGCAGGFGAVIGDCDMAVGMKPDVGRKLLATSGSRCRSTELLATAKVIGPCMRKPRDRRSSSSAITAYVPAGRLRTSKLPSGDVVVVCTIVPF